MISVVKWQITGYTKMFRIGQTIKLDCANKSVKSRICGWKPGRYILIDLEYESDSSTGLHVGDELVARLARRGKTFGFITSPAQFLYDQKVAVLKYPDSIEQDSDDTWYPTSMPVKILRTPGDHDLEDWSGVVRYVSVAGVRIVSPLGANVGEKLFLTFTLVAGGIVDNVQASVTSVVNTESGFDLTLKYIFLSETNKRALESFMDMISTRSGLL